MFNFRLPAARLTPGFPPPRLLGRVSAAGGLAAAALGLFLALASASPVLAAPTVQQTIDFARLELGALCRDAGRSQFSQIDRYTVGGVRSCDIGLTRHSLRLSVRQRASTPTFAAVKDLRPYARLSLNVDFSRDSGFLCGPSDEYGRATLFVACKTDLGLQGPECAERQVSIPRGEALTFTSSYRLAAAEILSMDAESCRVVARALDYIGERSRPQREQSARSFFE